MAAETFAPLRDLLPDNIESTGELASVPGLADLLDGLYYTDAWVDSSPTESRYTIVLGLFDGFAIQLPWLPGLELRLGATAAEPATIEVACSIAKGWSLSARGIPLQITFPPEILARADDPSRGSTVTVTADVTIDDRLNCDVEVSESIDLPLSLIGGTTLGLELQGLSFDLGATAERRGISARVAKIKLPRDLLDAPLDITFENFFAGEGGLSGRASWTAPEGPEAPVWDEQQHAFSGIGTGKLFGSLPISLRQVSIELVDSIPRQGRILAYAFVPYFEQVIAVEASVGSGRIELVLAAAPEAQPEDTPVSASGLVSLRRDDVLSIALNSLSIALRDGKVTIGVSGSVTPLFGGLDWPTFELEGLTIDSTGKVTISGGWIDVGKAGTIEINGATVEISKFALGSEPDGTKWFGASGGFKLAEPIPVSGSVEGFKVLFRGSDVWAQLRGVAVGFEIPDSVIFAGHLEFFEDPEEPRGNVPGKQRGFRGSGSLTILPTNMRISAEVLLGRSDGPPPFPFAYLFVNFQSPVGMPTPIPNVAAYGFAALCGLAMEPNKPPGAHWWFDWYLPVADASDSELWHAVRGALAFGGGLTIGTASDDGYAVNARLLLILVLPGPIIMLEGVAGFVSDRTLLGPNSPIHALAVLDGRAGQLLMNVSARYPFDDADEMNKLIKARGTAEAFFDVSGDWHLYLGERDPRSKRIAAEILNLFEARAYTMLLPDQLAFGVWIGYVKHWKKGPLKVDLEAWMDANATISWRPIQLAGDLTMAGELGLRAFGIGACLSVRAGVGAAAPRPYRLHAEIEAKLRMPRFVPDLKCHFELDYKEETTPAILDPIGKLGVEHLKVSEKWSLEGADSEDTAPIVPLDGKVAISFQRSVADLPLVGGSSISGTPPWERAGKFEFRYRLTEIRLERRPKETAPGAWETVAVRSTEQSDEAELWGVWLAADSASASAEASPNAPMTKLLLHAKSPFEYARENADDSWYEHFSDWHPDYGWIRVTPPKQICHDFTDLYPGHRTVVDEVLNRGDVILTGSNLTIDRQADAPVHLDLAVHNRGVWIVFPAPVRLVKLHFRSAKLRAVAFNGQISVHDQNVSLGAPGSVVIGAMDGPDFTSLFLNASTGLLAKFCYVTADGADQYQEESAGAESAAASDDHYDDPPGADLLLAQSFYRVTVTAQGQRRKRGESDIDETPFQRVAYFQTADPPGVFVKPNEGALATDSETQQYPAAGPLRDLSPYIAVRDDVPATPDLPSGADASRATTPLNGALTAYRGDDVGVTFNENDVEQMYLMAGMPLVLSLYDSNGRPVGSSRVAAAAADTVPALGSLWQAGDDDVEANQPTLQQHQVSRQQAQTQLDETNPVTGPVADPLALNTSIVFAVPAIDLTVVPPPQAIWVGGPDFVLEPRALYRAALEAVRPAAAIHLKDDGTPLLAADGTYLIDQIATDGSNLTQVLDDSVGLAEAGPKLLSDGRSMILHVAYDVPAAERPVIDMRIIQPIFAEFAGWFAGLGPPPQVYRWNFATSAFVSFAHHMHSFPGAAWDLRAAAAVPWTPLDAAARDALRSLIEADPPDAAALYAQAAAAFHVGGALPSAVEIHVLEDANGRYAFLIESPEPLDWRRSGTGRVTLALGYSAQGVAPPSLAPARVQVIECDVANEAVELMVTDDLHLSGYALERVVLAGGVEAAEPLYQFPAGSLYRAGTRIRLTTRAAAGVTVSPDVVSIGIGSPVDLLGGAAESIRIVDAAGTEVHRATFLPLAEYARKAVVTASDPDGTRTFVFLLAADDTWDSDVPDGTWQLELEYRRNAGAGRPVLRRGGSSASEHVLLSFSTPAVLH